MARQEGKADSSRTRRAGGLQPNIHKPGLSASLAETERWRSGWRKGGCGCGISQGKAAVVVVVITAAGASSPASISAERRVIL
jgi:hypothetical protein